MDELNTIQAVAQQLAAIPWVYSVSANSVYVAHTEMEQIAPLTAWQNTPGTTAYNVCTNGLQWLTAFNFDYAALEAAWAKGLPRWRAP